MDRRKSADILPNDADEARSADAAVDAWRFDGFEFDLRRGELRGRGGEPIALRPKAELLLRHFLARPGHLLTREELMTAVWPTTVVTDDSLVQCVGDLRHALGDHHQCLIGTVPRRGYRFESSVEPVATQARPPPAGVTDTTAADATQAATSPAPKPRPLRRPLVRLMTGLTLVATLGLGGFAALVWQLTAARPGIDDEIAARHVISVMPFAVDGNEPALREAADRVADQICAQIAAEPSGRCIGRARSAVLAGAPLPQVARELSAVYVLTGRVSSPSRAGQAAAVELQLVGTANGALIGAQRLDLARGTEAGQDIGQQAMNFIHGRFGAIDEAVATRPGHTPDAADLTMLGWVAVIRRRGPADMASARQHFERALREDPNSIIALNGLGAVYLQERPSRVRLTAAQAAASEQAIERALRLAPNDSTAAINWSLLQTFNGRPDLALLALEKANRIQPAWANGHLKLARTLLSLGRFDEVQVEAQRATQLAMLGRDASRSSSSLQVEAEAALMQLDDARALALARRAVAENPTSGEAHAVLAAAEALSGDAEQAATGMAMSQRLSPRTTIDNFDEWRRSAEPRYVAARARLYEGLRAAGMPQR